MLFGTTRNDSPFRRQNCTDRRRSPWSIESGAIADEEPAAAGTSDDETSMAVSNDVVVSASCALVSADDGDNVGGDEAGEKGDDGGDNDARFNEMPAAFAALMSPRRTLRS